METIPFSTHLPEEYLLDLFEKSPYGIVIHSEGRIKYINPACMRLLAGNNLPSRDQLTGTNVFDFIPGTDQSTIIQRISEAMTTNSVAEPKEEVFVLPDGSRRVVEVSGVPFVFYGKPAMQVVIQDISGRKLMEDKVVKSEGQLRTLINGAAEGIVFQDSKGVILEWNKEAERIFGFSAEQVTGKSSIDTTWKTYRPDGSLWKAAEHPSIITLNTGKALYNQLMRVESADGLTSWISVNTSPVMSPDTQSPEAVIITFKDITSQRETEEKLRVKDKIFEALLENTPIYVFFKDSEIRAIHLSRNFEKMLGMPLSEILGKSMDDLFPSELAKSMIEDDKRIINEGKLITVDEELNGRYYTTIKFPISIENSPPMLAGFTIDITDRELAKQALVHNNQAFIDVVNAIPSGLFIYRYESPDRLYLELGNPAAGHLTGINVDDWIGKEFNEIWPNARHDGLTEKYLNVLRTGKNIELEDVVYKDQRVDGAFRIHVFIVPDNRLGVSFENITRIKEAENELVKAKERAEESDRLKTAFLQNMSHEIRTPMNAIVGFSGFLTEPGLAEDKRINYSEIIIKSSLQLLYIVNDILTISAIDTHQERLILKPVSIQGLVNDVFALFEPIARNRGIAFEQKMQIPQTDFYIMGDSTKLTQIFTNLLNNAFKFTTSGKVQLYCSLNGDALEFCVSDTGIGFAAEMKEKIFERFFQINSRTNNKQTGTGLGLAISRAFAGLMGGRIWAESQVGKGSEFYFTLPYLPCPPPGPKGGTTTLSGTKLTVLVAEDEEYNYLYLKELLLKAGAEVIYAANGQEAVDYCQSNPDIGLVLMDLKMPVLDGYQATKKIRDFRPELPVVAQTAYVFDVGQPEFKEAGFQGVLAKPIRYDELDRIIRSNCSKR